MYKHALTKAWKQPKLGRPVIVSRPPWSKPRKPSKLDQAAATVNKAQKSAPIVRTTGLVKKS